MNGGALQHALESSGRPRLRRLMINEIIQFILDLEAQLIPQIRERNAARAQHRHRVLIIGQGV